MIKTILTILFLLALITLLIVLMKYLAGDFSPVNIEETGKEIVEQIDKTGNVISKTIVYSYKYSYRDGRVKYKIKKVRL